MSARRRLSAPGTGRQDYCEMQCLFSPVDLAAAGLGLDVCGALVVARGLFPSARQIADRAWTDLEIDLSKIEVGPFATRFKVDNPSVLLGQVEDKVDGRAGVTMLVLGFLGQGASAVLTIAGLGGATGGPAMLVALGVLAASFLIAGSVYWFTRRWAISRTLSNVLAQQDVHPHFADACRRMLREGGRERGVMTSRI